MRDEHGAGTPGASARREHERRKDKRSREVLERHPTVGRLILRMTNEPQTTRSWATGAAGEERVGARLERLIGDRGVVLHDRKRPRSVANIDHIVIGPTGIIVVDTKRYRGKVERRPVGSFLQREHRLFVGGRDRTSKISGLLDQLADVRSVVDPDERALCSAAMCLSGADWPLLASPFVIDGVTIGWTKSIAKTALAGAALDGEAIRRLASRLGRSLPPA